jgi:hypothetical protein
MPQSQINEPLASSSSGWCSSCSVKPAYYVAARVDRSAPNDRSRRRRHIITPDTYERIFAQHLRGECRERMSALSEVVEADVTASRSSIEIELAGAVVRAMDGVSGDCNRTHSVGHR